MINNLKKRIEKEYFKPSVLGLLTNPFFIARRELYNSIEELGKEINGKTLDVGCGTKPYKELFLSKEYYGLEYDTGIDQDKKTADFYYDGKTFPFSNNEYDSVVTNQVLEHVFNPDEFLSEICRVTKPGGMLLLTVPFVWDEHEQPHDFARYSSFGLTALLSRHGFEVVKLRKNVNDFRVLVQLLTGYIYKKTHGSFIIKQAAQLLLIFPINFIGMLLAKLLPANNDLYLDNVVLAKKKIL